MPAATLGHSIPSSGKTAGRPSGATTVYYLSSGDDEIAEYDVSGNLKRRFVPGPGVDQPIAMVKPDGTKTFFHQDKTGSVIAMTDASGAVVKGAIYTYDPFGNCVVNGQACGQDDDMAYRFTGRRYDPETGLYYYRARYYSPALGRFLQTDPIGYKDDIDWYAYVGNDPTDRVDPTGLNWFNVSGKWEWHSGSWYTPQGTNFQLRSDYTGMLFAKITGHNDLGATTYALSLYNQNRLVATANAVSGGVSNGHRMAPLKNGSYEINLAHQGTPQLTSNGEPYSIRSGMQKMPQRLNPWWGPFRARIERLGGGVVDQENGNFYVHSHMNGVQWSHGCISTPNSCDLQEIMYTQMSGRIGLYVGE